MIRKNYKKISEATTDDFLLVACQTCRLNNDLFNTEPEIYCPELDSLLSRKYCRDLFNELIRRHNEKLINTFCKSFKSKHRVIFSTVFSAEETARANSYMAISEAVDNAHAYDSSKSQDGTAFSWIYGFMKYMFMKEKKDLYKKAVHSLKFEDLAKAGKSDLPETDPKEFHEINLKSFEEMLSSFEHELLKSKRSELQKKVIRFIVSELEKGDFSDFKALQEVKRRAELALQIKGSYFTNVLSKFRKYKKQNKI